MQKGQHKMIGDKRTMNAGASGKARRHDSKAGFQTRDPKGRLGGFEGAGEHSRNTVRQTEKR